MDFTCIHVSNNTRIKLERQYYPGKNTFPRKRSEAGSARKGRRAPAATRGLGPLGDGDFEYPLDAAEGVFQGLHAAGKGDADVAGRAEP
jgi:hypothetical protein